MILIFSTLQNCPETLFYNSHEQIERNENGELCFKLKFKSKTSIIFSFCSMDIELFSLKTGSYFKNPRKKQYR